MHRLIVKYKSIIVLLISLFYLLINLFLIVEKDFYYLLGLPALLILTYLYFYRFDYLFYFLVFVTPLSIIFSSKSIGMGLSIPSEPLLISLSVLFILRLVASYKYDLRVFKHPISIILMIQIIWMFLTCLSSEIHWVSFKYLAVRVWFVIPLVFMIMPLLKDLKKMKTFFLLYAIGLLIIVFFTMINHARWGFTEESAHWVMTPFYNDHTAYAAAIAMFIPALFLLLIDPSMSLGNRIALGIVFVIFIFAIILSFSRAAWISVACSLLVYFIIKFRIKFIWLLFGGIIVFILFINYQNEIIFELKKNKQDSSEIMLEHVQSISNISSDDSNLERINRWQSALRMFKERPILGWGPGTYQFVYAPFQRAKEKTVITTNAGNLGSVHSEYLGPLAEMGAPGLLLTLLLLFYVFYTGIRFYYQSPNSMERNICLAAILGLVSYFTHGLMNNFLETDKLAVPVFLFISILISQDLYLRKRETKKDQNEF